MDGLRNYSEKLVSLQEKLSRLEQENVDLKTQIQEHEGSADEHSILKSRMAETTSQIEQVQAELAESHKKASSAEQKYADLNAEKMRRMEGAGFSRQIKLDRIAELEWQLKTAVKEIEKLQKNLAEKSKAVEDLTSLNKDVNRKMSQLGHKKKVVETALEAYKKAEADAKKAQKRNDSEEVRQESQTIQDLREKLAANEGKLKEVKGDLNRAEATLMVMNNLQDKRIGDAVAQAVQGKDRTIQLLLDKQEGFAPKLMEFEALFEALYNDERAVFNDVAHEHLDKMLKVFQTNPDLLIKMMGGGHGPSV